jgi:hypothetical protein
MKVPADGLTDLEVSSYPWAEYESPGQERVDFLLLGDPRDDPRCT